MLSLSDRESILFHSAAVPSWSCASIVWLGWRTTQSPDTPQLHPSVYGIDSLKCTDQAGLPAFWRQLESSGSAMRSWSMRMISRASLQKSLKCSESRRRVSVSTRKRNQTWQIACIKGNIPMLSRWWMTFGPTVIIFTYGWPGVNSCIYEYIMILNLTTVEEKRALS